MPAGQKPPEFQKQTAASLSGSNMGLVHLSDASKRSSLFYKTAKQNPFGRGTVREGGLHVIMGSIAREQESRRCYFLLPFFCAQSLSSSLWWYQEDLSLASLVISFLKSEGSSTFPLFKEQIICRTGRLLIPCKGGKEGSRQSKGNILHKHSWLWKTIHVLPHQERPLAHWLHTQFSS